MYREREIESNRSRLHFEILPFLMLVFRCVGFLCLFNATVAFKNIDNIILTNSQL